MREFFLEIYYWIPDIVCTELKIDLDIEEMVNISDVKMLKFAHIPTLI